MRSLLFPAQREPVAADDARRIAELGYDGVWVGELWGTDAFVQLATLAHHADGVALGTAIANVYSRSPAALAQAGATLTALTDAPVRLGIGPSTPKAVEDLHGAAYDRPVRRLHEAAELIAAFTARARAG